MLLISSCSIKKKNTQKSEIKTEVKEQSIQILIDTSKTQTIDTSYNEEIIIRDFEVQKDSVKGLVSILKKETIKRKGKSIKKTNENKAITGAKKENRVITQKVKEKSIQKSVEPNPFNFVVKLVLWVLLLAGFVLLCLYLKKKFRP